MTAPEMLTEIEGLLDDAIALKTREFRDIPPSDRWLADELIVHLRRVRNLYRFGTCTCASCSEPSEPELELATE